MFWMFDAQNRAGGLSHDLFRRTPKKRMGNSCPAMCSDGYQIYVIFLGSLDDFQERRPPHDDIFDFDLLKKSFGYQVMDVLFASRSMSSYIFDTG